MSYENAPGTRLLATQCAVCQRPLLDAKSVELGIGPVCREHGFNIDVAPGAREEANRIVHDIAIEYSTRGPLTPPVTFLKERLSRLEALGFTKLASKIVEGVATIKIELDGETLLVRAPYDPTLITEWRKVGRWDGDRKVRLVPASKARELYSFFQRYYHGVLGIGPKGVFVVNGGSL